MRKLRTRAEDYVHKPIAFGELLQHIQSFVRLGGATYVKRSPATTGLVPPAVVTVTSSDPVPAGESAVIEIGELTV